VAAEGGEGGKRKGDGNRMKEGRKGGWGRKGKK